MNIRYYGDTHIGMKRETNQDNFGMSSPEQSEHYGHLLVVCDGMGGHESGEVASRIGVDTILEWYYKDQDNDRTAALERAFLEANRRISQHGTGHMGTTGVAALFLRNWLHVANVGDSRAYLIRNGQIKQISRDHSLVAEQVAAGIVTAEQARHLNYRNMITRALGYRADVQVDIFSLALRAGDMVLLSTDGLHGLVGDQELVQVATKYERDPKAAVQQLIAMANERGGVDNITVALGIVDALDARYPASDSEEILVASKHLRPNVALRDQDEADQGHPAQLPPANPIFLASPPVPQPTQRLPTPPSEHSPDAPASPTASGLPVGLIAVGTVTAVLLIVIGTAGMFFVAGMGGGSGPDEGTPTIQFPGLNAETSLPWIGTTTHVSGAPTDNAVNTTTPTTSEPTTTSTREAPNATSTSTASEQSKATGTFVAPEPMVTPLPVQVTVENLNLTLPAITVTPMVPTFTPRMPPLTPIPYVPPLGGTPPPPPHGPSIE